MNPGHFNSVLRMYGIVIIATGLIAMAFGIVSCGSSKATGTVNLTLKAGS